MRIVSELKQRIIELRDQIASAENELEKVQEAYMTEAGADGVLTEEYNGWGFYIQNNPPSLDLTKASVPREFYKPTIDNSAVRKYLLEHGNQSWGALKDDKPFKLMVKKLKQAEAA